MVATAHADFIFSERVSIQSTIEVIDPAHSDGPDRFSADGLEPYVESDRPGGYGDRNIHVATHGNRDEECGSTGV